MTTRRWTPFLAHDAEIVAVRDIHPPYVDFAAQKAGGSSSKSADYRRLLEMKDVDAVVISTPDHPRYLGMMRLQRL